MTNTDRLSATEYPMEALLQQKYKVIREKTLLVEPYLIAHKQGEPPVAELSERLEELQSLIDEALILLATYRMSLL